MLLRLCVKKSFQFYTSEIKKMWYQSFQFYIRWYQFNDYRRIESISFFFKRNAGFYWPHVFQSNIYGPLFDLLCYKFRDLKVKNHVTLFSQCLWNVHAQQISCTVYKNRELEKTIVYLPYRRKLHPLHWGLGLYPRDI